MNLISVTFRHEDREEELDFSQSFFKERSIPPTFESTFNRILARKKKKKRGETRWKGGRKRERERREVKSGAARSYFRSRRSASGPTEVRNDRLKEVLLRDKPEVIRLRPKHFFPLPTKNRSFWPGLRPLDEHPFSFNAFIYRPLLFLSTPSFPSLPDPANYSPLLYSPASFVRFVRWHSIIALASRAIALHHFFLFSPPFCPSPACSPGRLIIRMIPLEPFLVSSMLPRLAMVLIIIVGRIPVVEDSSFQDPSKMINNCSSVFKRFFLARLNIPYYSFFFFIRYYI